MTNALVLAVVAAAVLPALVAGACSDITTVQSQVTVDTVKEGTIPWLCTPPAGELKLGKVVLSAATETSLPIAAQYREKVDTEPTIQLTCQVPVLVAITLFSGGDASSIDISTLTTTCSAPDNKVYFAMKDRVLVGPAPDCKKIRVEKLANGTYTASDYTGTDGPTCGQPAVTTAAPTAAAVASNASNAAPASLVLATLAAAVAAAVALL